MLINGVLTKHMGATTGGSPHGEKLLKTLKHLNDDIIGGIWTVAYEFGNEKCTYNFRTFYTVLQILEAFGKLIVKVLPGVLKMIGNIVVTILTTVKKALSIPKKFTDALWNM